LTRSKELGDKLFVIVNNDLQREMKGSKEFMSEDERKFIV
jgi:glycerol-3-phosphate cytidylyltransferase-like family protein